MMVSGLYSSWTPSVGICKKQLSYLPTVARRSYQLDWDWGSLLRFHRAHIFTDNCFSFTSTLADAMHSMDVFSRLAYLILPYHAPSARVLIRFLSGLHFTYCTNADCRLVPGYLFFLRFSFWFVNSYTYVSRLRLSRLRLSRLRLSPFVSSTRLCLPLPLMPFLL